MTFKTLTRWYGKLFNRRVQRRLSSSAHDRLSNNHVLITMTGRRSGRQITLPVNYRRVTDEPLNEQKDAEEKIVIGTEADWWLNLKNGAEVQLQLAGRARKGYARPVPEDAPRRAQYGRMLSGPTWRWFANTLIIIEITLLP